MRWVVALALMGCGRVWFDEVARPDGDAVGNPDTDVAPDAVQCTFGPWGPPMNLAINTSSDDWSPTLSDDGLELIFQSNRGGDENLYQSVRASTSDPFTTATELVVLNSPQSEKAPTLSPDRMTVYFSSDRSGTARLYRSTRPTPEDPFGAVELVPGLETTTVEGPALSVTEDELFFMDGGAPEVTRVVLSGGAFVSPQLLTELGEARYPDLSRDRLTLYFARSTPDALLQATRSAVGATLGAPAPVSGIVVMNASETDPELGDRDRTLLFTSDRSGGAGAVDIYIVTRPCD